MTYRDFAASLDYREITKAEYSDDDLIVQLVEVHSESDDYFTVRYCADRKLAFRMFDNLLDAGDFYTVLYHKYVLGSNISV